MPGAENLDGGEGGADYGELGGVLRDAGDRRKRPAWMVVVAAVMFSSVTTSFEFVHAIGWLDPQHTHVMFVVILDQTLCLK